MSLIPIGFKADSETNARKGKIRAEDYAALTACSLPRKTGVLDLLNKINYDGITINSGVATITLHSGYAVICGRPVKVEEGTTHDVVLPSSSENGYFGIRVDLGASADNECTFFAKTGGLTQDDLNENPLDGIYELALYTYTATASTFVITGSVADLISVSSISEGSVYTADANGTIDRSKTIAEKLNGLDARLTTLGFKSGDSNITAYSGVTITYKSIKRIGNFVIGKVICTLDAANQVLFRLGKNFRPKSGILNNNISGSFGLVHPNDSEAITVRFWNTDGGNGNVDIYFSGSPYRLSGEMTLLFGFEADPWEEE